MTQFLSIPTRKLNNGVTIPHLGLGVFEDTFDVSRTEQAVLSAIDQGYRLIDTAAVYKNEEEVGKAIKKSPIAREDLFITTKVWDSDQGYDSTLRAYDASLEKLQLDYLDLYLIHWPVKAKRKETWRALEYLYTEGKVKAIGVSNYLKPHLEELLSYTTIIPAVNQIEFTPFCNEDETYRFCNDHQITLESYSPLVRGLKKEHPLLNELGQKYHKSTFQILLRWQIEKGVITIPKSNKPERIAQNRDVFDFSLNDQEMQQLNNLHDGTRVAYDPMEYL